MKSSTTTQNKLIKLFSIAFWLIVWQVATVVIGEEIFLPSPLAVVKRMTELVIQEDFLQSVFNSFVRIVGGFLIAVIFGVAFAVLASRFKIVKYLLSPLVVMIKTVSVASIIILVLIWFSSKNLAIIISFLIIFPIIYTNTLSGIENVNKNLLEMAKVFCVSPFKKVRYIYLFQIYPYFRSGCSVGLGLCWKSGIAAEVIGLPDKSIGEHIFTSKIYLDTPDLFAWTFFVVIISITFEKIFLFCMDNFVKKLEKG